MTHSTGASVGGVPFSSASYAETRARWAAGGRPWVPQVVNGVLSVLVGVAILVWPRVSLGVVAVLIAITLAVNGVVQLWLAVSARGTSGSRRVFLGVLGALSLLAAALCLRSPVQTLGLLTIVIGSWWLFSGVLTAVGAFPDDRERMGRGWTVATGVVSAVAGLVVILQPAISLAALVVTLGVAAIVLGVLTVVEGIRSRGRARHLAQAS